MPPSAYPTNGTLYRPFEEEAEPSSQISKSPDFPDGGCDYNVDADTDTRRFRIRYSGLTAVEKDSIRTHAASAKYNPELGSAYGFSFTTRAGESLSAVHYAPGGLVCTHTKTWSWTVDVLLIKRP